jgi:hypothetical protein
MRRYSDIVTLIGSAMWASRLARLNQSEMTSFKEECPQCPDDYLDYLHEVGWGMIGDSSYMIYQGLLSSDEIYDPVTASDLSHILFFGDDLMGYCAGFDTSKSWNVVEVQPVDMSAEEVGQTFEEFIREQILAQFGAV